ncbi:MAG TPA: carbohydrate ABC transporter permease, partial [Arthrobacter sp.]
MSLTTNPRTADSPTRAVLQNRPKQTLRARYGDRTFSIAATAILLLSILAVVYPLYFILIASVSDPNAIYEGKVWLFPSGVTLEGYQRIFADSRIWNGLGNTLVYTVS